MTRHPAPWVWDRERFPSALLDAKGNKLMWIQGWDEDSEPWLAFASPEVKEAIEGAAAPPIGRREEP